MPLLAIDTSSAATVVAVGADDGTVLAARRHDPQGRERPQHTTQGLALAADALDAAGLSWRDLTRLGVGVGPGSFTGLRSGIAAMTALALRLDLPVVALRGPELLAAGAGAAAGPVLAVIDGRRGELFVERFDDPAAAPHGAGAPTLIAIDDAAGLTQAAGTQAVGDGAQLAAAQLAAAGAHVPPADDPRHRIAADALAQCTLAGTPVSAAELRPAYGRQADAIPTAERNARR